MIQQHGGNIQQFENILDFSANINPLGMPEKVRSAIIEGIDDIEKYPDPYCTELRKKLAEHEKIPAENIVCGNGADDLIFRIVNTVKPRRALICTPTFSEYSRALGEIECDIDKHTLTEENSFTLTEAFLEKLDNSHDICFICTPNNPTGRLVDSEMLKAIAEKCEQNGTFLVCDECFMGFAEGVSLSRFMNPKCIILRAFTKFYAMAGIRLGYAICGDSGIAGKIQESGQFWSVSSIAQAAGIAALDDAEFISRTVEYVKAERNFLICELSGMGIKVFDSSANFILFKEKNGLCEKLLNEGILIRDCRNFSGLSEKFYRIAVRTHGENIRLIATLRRCLNG